MKFTYSRALELDPKAGIETFTAAECASFDEAQKHVEKGIYDRRLQISTAAPAVKIPSQSTTPGVGSQNVPHNGGYAASTTTPAGQTSADLPGSAPRS